MAAPAPDRSRRNSRSCLFVIDSRYVVKKYVWPGCKSLLQRPFDDLRRKRLPWNAAAGVGAGSGPAGRRSTCPTFFVPRRGTAGQGWAGDETRCSAMSYAVPARCDGVSRDQRGPEVSRCLPALGSETVRQRLTSPRAGFESLVEPLSQAGLRLSEWPHRRRIDRGVILDHARCIGDTRYVCK
jgi:hypothetical protein